MTEEADATILEDVFTVTGGTSSWKDHQGWPLDGGEHHHLRDAHGLSQNSKGRVERVDLSGNGLVGEIPLAFTKLQWLKSLDLSYNNLSGPPHAPLRTAPHRLCPYSSLLPLVFALTPPPHTRES
jgi:hypothetical protein